jgi:hypothetical protein
MVLRKRLSGVCGSGTKIFGSGRREGTGGTPLLGGATRAIGAGAGRTVSAGTAGMADAGLSLVSLAGSLAAAGLMNWTSTVGSGRG